jgi:hypothetical protein
MRCVDAFEDRGGYFCRRFWGEDGWCYWVVDIGLLSLDDGSETVDLIGGMGVGVGVKDVIL